MHLKIAGPVLMTYFIAIQVKQGKSYNLNLYLPTISISIGSYSEKKLANTCFKYFVPNCMLYRYLFKSFFRNVLIENEALCSSLSTLDLSTIITIYAKLYCY